MRPHPESLYAALRRQATYALAVFVCATFILEAVVPGSVLPFLDIVPLGVVALLLLAYDAVRSPSSSTFPWIPAIAAMAFSVVLSAGFFLFGEWGGRSGSIAFVVMTIGLVLLAIRPKKW
ncbi:MAG: hypothetical protein RL141_1089 [Candidatus Parcubacteria bacterium]|jgi:hypothetical protein